MSRSTVHRWLSAAAANGADPRLVRFREAVRKAEADAEVHSVGVLRRAAGQGDWRAALAHLKRRYPERWGRRPPAAAQQSPAEREAAPGSADLDAADPQVRALLSELLRRR